MQSITNEKNKYEKYLLKAGLKFTPARQEVFDEVMHLHGHFATEELVKECKTNKRQASRATIYRTLKELLEVGIVRETAFGDKHQHFEHVYDEKPHHHAKCIRCGKFTEFPDLGEDEIYQPVLEKIGFEVLGHEMHFYGICKNCK